MRDPLTGLEWQQSLSAPLTITDAQQYCAGLTLAGGSWRLPTLIELDSIVDFTRSRPAIAPAVFPGTPNADLWTSSPTVISPTSTRSISFSYGIDGWSLPAELAHARCVRSTRPVPIRALVPGPPAGRYTLTATAAFDTQTGLTWQRDAPTTRVTWAEAGAACQSLTLGGLSGWRLPTVQELKTLVDVRAQPLALDPLIFPNTLPADYWSSTIGFNTATAWRVDARTSIQYPNFQNGMTAYARCVR